MLFGFKQITLPILLQQPCCVSMRHEEMQKMHLQMTKRNLCQGTFFAVRLFQETVYSHLNFFNAKNDDR